MLMAQSSAFNAVPISTAYDSLGPEGLTHALNETEVRSMFTNGDLLGTLAKIISKCETVRLIVYDGKADEKVKAEIEKTREGLKVIHLDEVYALGKENPVECIKAKRDDIYCCMYTSGSSEYSYCTALKLGTADNVAGTPKGVLLSHGNVVAASEYHPTM
jgi:long-chain acyl-CoA synthetase